MVSRSDFDPLSVIPSSTLLKGRLEKVLEQARKLKILLKTAKQIEAEDASEQGVRDADQPA